MWKKSRQRSRKNAAETPIRNADPKAAELTKRERKHAAAKAESIQEIIELFKEGHPSKLKISHKRLMRESFA